MFKLLKDISVSEGQGSFVQQLRDFIYKIEKS